MMTNQENNRINSQEQSQNAQQSASDNQSQHKCANCGWGTTPIADICENCGEWQLKGKCNFCYAEVEDGQRFCSECGNPPTGITCGFCGTLSHFDFCPKCNSGLTKQSTETIQLIANSVEFQNVVNALVNTDSIDESGEINDQGIDTLKNYLSKFTEKKTKKKSSFSLNDKPDSSGSENLKSLQESKKNISTEQLKELEIKNKEVLAMKLLEDTRAKIFPNNQEARKFFGALKVLLPQVIQKKNPTGWRCNAFYNLHAGGPQECSATCSGGTWIYEIVTENGFNHTAI